jgi:uridylate kinase
MQRQPEEEPPPRPRWKRILLKLSGEILAGEANVLDHSIVQSLARQIGEVHDLGFEIAVVVGGGNIFRGTEAVKTGQERASADTIGMLATCINGLALQDELERQGHFTRLLTAIKMEQVAEPFIRRRAIRHLEKGRIVILAAGTGNPYFTTDTAAVLRAVECGCDVLLKGTKVDGIYTADPARDPTARPLTRLRYQDVLDRELRVMDLTAITLCKENNLPLVVFNVQVPGNFLRLARGDDIGTIVQQEVHDG